VRMLDELTLVTITPGAGALSATPTRTEYTVYCEAESVTSAEFWRADANGKRVDRKFLIHPDEYTGQMEVKYSGVTYNVVRTFLGPRGYQELYCARR